MIDLMDTVVGERLKRVKLLMDSVAWIEALTPQLKVKIVREWIQQDQLMGGGIDSSGEVIGYYSMATEFMSGGRKQEGDPYTLNDTGAFYQSMFVRVLSDAMIIEADANKMEDQPWWDENILNLTDENLQKLIEDVRANYTKYVRRILQLD